MNERYPLSKVEMAKKENKQEDISNAGNVDIGIN